MSEPKDWFDLAENQVLPDSKPEAPKEKRKAKAEPALDTEPAPQRGDNNDTQDCLVPEPSPAYD